jgi:cyclophilin family peptidyl-prolyl cis-trans isomerase
VTRRAWLVAGAAALALAACGGDTEPAAQPSTQPADEPADEPDDEPGDEPDDGPADDAEPAGEGVLVPGDPATGKPDVQLPATEPDDLVVTILIEGQGAVVEAGDTITVDYVGVLTADGTEFDNSYDRGQSFPLTIGVGQVIQGWDQGLVGVKEGSRVKLDIPAALAYGEQGAGPIPPNAAITFVVDILEPPPPPTLPPRADAADCPPVDGSGEQQQEFSEYPPTCIDIDASYTAEIVTNFGTLTIELDPVRAPLAVNSFVTLARYRYFDGTECHRAIPEFVVQCGDPTATGSGGPGYRFADELPDAGEYRIGSLAMANAGPDTNGSQFFIITGERGAALPPQYTLFGEVVDGLDTTLPDLDAVANPDNNGVPPLQQILIESVTITES